ncbi:MAG: hypothetical protein AAF384_16540 [Pseudomonadota bacterium]
MNSKSQMVCIWGGFGFAAVCLMGFILAGFIPPMSPSLSAREIAAIYSENTLSMRFAVLLIMTSAGFICFFVAGIASQLQRIEGGTGPYTMAQISAGSLTALIFVFAAVFYTQAAFRPDRAPEFIRIMNDLGWTTMLMTFAPFIFQNFAIALCILSDQNETPIFPRWVGYYNFWVAVSFIPGGMLTFFKTGPFAWDGLFVWWVPFTMFFGWYVLMFFIVRKAALTGVPGTT